MVEEEKMPSSGRGIPRKALDDDIISPAKLLTDLRDSKYLDAVWPSQSPQCVGLLGYDDPTGATGNTNFCQFGGPFGGQAAYHIKGAVQTILAPTQNGTTGRLDAGLDDAAAEGVEYIFGGLTNANNPLGGTVGSLTRGNKFLRMQFSLDDASEAAECAVGFRFGEASQALLDSYNDTAVINIQAGVVNVETIVDGAAATTTAISGISAVADNDVVIAEVQMKGGHPTFIFTNVTQGESKRFQVPVAEDMLDAVVYVPFFYFLQGAAGCALAFDRITAGDVLADQEHLQF